MKILVIFLLIFGAILIGGCVQNSQNIDSGLGGSYSCVYESRHTGCGGKGWSEWKAECYAFNMDDYKEGWTPEKVCGKYAGSDTDCGGGCCIGIEYRNNTLSRNGC